MKLCGRIDADSALLRYRHLLRAEKHDTSTVKRARKRFVVARAAANEHWRRRLANAAR